MVSIVEMEPLSQTKLRVLDRLTPILATEYTEWHGIKNFGMIDLIFFWQFWILVINGAIQHSDGN
jgi:hypothetical protein